MCKRSNRFTCERGRASDVTMWRATVRSHFVKTTTYSECSRVNEDNLQYLWDILPIHTLRLMTSQSAVTALYTRYVHKRFCSSQRSVSTTCMRLCRSQCCKRDVILKHSGIATVFTVYQLVLFSCATFLRHQSTMSQWSNPSIPLSKLFTCGRRGSSYRRTRRPPPP